MPYRENECTPETCSAARRVAELEREVEKLQKPSWWSRLRRKKPLPVLPSGRVEAEFWASGGRWFTIRRGVVLAKNDDNWWYNVERGIKLDGSTDRELDRLLGEWQVMQKLKSDLEKAQ